MAAEEGDDRPDHRVERGSAGRGASLGVLRRHHRVGALRLASGQRGADPDHHQPAVEGVAHRPSGGGGEKQDQRLGGEQGEAVAQAVGGGEQAELVRTVGDLDAPGVDDGILGRGADAGQQAKGDQGGEVRAGIAQRHADQPGRHAELGEDHPAPPPPEPGDQRRRQAVDHRAPQELHRVGQADPRGEADGGEGDAVFLEPEAQGVADQHEGQAGGEAQRQHHRDLGPGQGVQHLTGAASRGGSRGRLSHARLETGSGIRATPTGPEAVRRL